jgi:putative Mg2+ transporter-C (MgtC) family protein
MNGLLLTAATNLGTAVALGALIGTERQLRQRMAGLRTNALVALGAASFVVFAATFDDVSPTRVAAQIVSGIGFLGAGIIFRDGFTVSGLNTAATLWCAAAVGMLAGHGALDLAALVTGFVVLVNFGLRPVVKLIKRIARGGNASGGFAVTVICRPEQEVAVRSLIVQGFAAAGLHLSELAASEVDMSGRVAVSALIAGGAGGQAAVEAIAGRLSLDPAVLSVRWGRSEAD